MSRYPPGIEAIINAPRRTVQRSDGTTSTTTDLDVSPVSSRSNSRHSTARSQHSEARSQAGSARPQLSGREGWNILSNMFCVPTRETMVDVVKQVAQNLRQLRDDMYATLKEYYHCGWVINWFQMPSWRFLRKSFKRLKGTLNHLATSLNSKIFADDAAAKFLFHAIKSPLNAVVSEGDSILKMWNDRSGRQEPAKPLTGKSRSLRAISIHDSDGKIRNLGNMAIQTDALILQELRQRQSKKARKQKGGRGWDWLNYSTPVCPDFGDCQHGAHQYGY